MSVSLGQTPVGTETTPAPSPLGTPVRYLEYPGNTAHAGEVTLNGAEWHADSPSESGGGAYTLYPQNDAFLVLDVTYTGVKGKVGVEDGVFWKAYTSDGAEFGKAFSSNFKPKMEYGNLTAGESARGLIVLDVKRGPVTVVWSGAMGMEPVASWSVAG